MNINLMKSSITIATLIGISVSVQGAAMTVTGNDAPSTYSAPNTQVINQYLKTYPAPTLGQMEQFSATIERGDVVTAPSAVNVVSGSRSLPKNPLSISPTAITAVGGHSSSAQGASPQTSSFPCPIGYTSSVYPQSGNASCTLDQLDTISMPTGQDPTLTVESSLSVDSKGNGLIGSMYLGDYAFNFGYIVQRVIDNDPGQILYPAQYSNYFFGDRQTAMLFAQMECNSGVTVTYMPTGIGVSNSGYQVQVIDWSPDYGDPMYPYLPGPSNSVCPPPSNNN